MFTPADDTPAAPPVVVLSHHAWQGTYGGDPSIVGATLVVEGHPFTVVGVTPPGFFGETLRGDPPDLWIPLQQEPLINGDTSLLRQPVSAWLRVIGRLRPGATTDGMGAAADRHPAPVDAARLRLPGELDAGRHPGRCRSRSIAVVPAGAGVGIMKEQYGRSLQILLGVCGLVLLIACANVANLLLARAVARRGQTAVRLAMGASRRQIVTQALVESVLLAVAGGIAGLVVAIGTARLLLALAFAGATLPADRHAAVAAGARRSRSPWRSSPASLFGAAPAWFATRTDPIDALRGAGRSTGDHSSFTRKALLVVQATLSVVLVAGSTMLARSLGNLEGQDFGFEIDGRVLVPLNRPPATYTRREARRALSRRRGAAQAAARRARRGARALQPAHRQLGRAGARRRPSAAEARRADRRVVGSRQRELPAGPRREAGARPPLHRAPTTRRRSTSRSSTKRSSAASSRATRIRSISTSASTCRRTSTPTASSASCATRSSPASSSIGRRGRCSTCRWRRPSTTRNPMMKRVETASHFVRGLLLVTDMPPGALEPQVEAGAGRPPIRT